MADKVQLIKEEIERLYNLYELSNDYQRMGACSTILQFIDSLLEEHNEDLENQYKSNIRYQHTYMQDDLIKTKSEDLEEYYKKEFLPKEWFAKPGQRTISQFNFFTARHFAEWQKQQMMKDAVDATVLDVDAQTIEFGLWPEKLLSIKEGDKVKIIIVKEEQQ